VLLIKDVPHLILSVLLLWRIPSLVYILLHFPQEESDIYEFWHNKCKEQFAEFIEDIPYLPFASLLMLFPWRIFDLIYEISLLVRTPRQGSHHHLRLTRALILYEVTEAFYDVLCALGGKREIFCNTTHLPLSFGHICYYLENSHLYFGDQSIKGSNDSGLSSIFIQSCSFYT